MTTTLARLWLRLSCRVCRIPMQSNCAENGGCSWQDSSADLDGLTAPEAFESFQALFTESVSRIALLEGVIRDMAIDQESRIKVESLYPCDPLPQEIVPRKSYHYVRTDIITNKHGLCWWFETRYVFLNVMICPVTNKLAAFIIELTNTNFHDRLVLIFCLHFASISKEHVTFLGGWSM